MKACSGSGGTAPLILTSALDGGEWSTSIPGRFSPGKELRYQLNRRLAGSQNQDESLGEEKTLLPVHGFERRILHPVA
jgi:hypothetical protein